MVGDGRNGLTPSVIRLWAFNSSLLVEPFPIANAPLKALALVAASTQPVLVKRPSVWQAILPGRGLSANDHDVNHPGFCPSAAS